MELLAAMLVSGLVLATVHAILVALADVETRVRIATSEADANGIGERLLADVLARASTGVDSSATFGGDSVTLELRSSCARGGGWLEPCGLRLRIDPGVSTPSLVMSEQGRTVQLLPPGVAKRFLFAERSSGSIRWLSGWSVSTDAPFAVAIVTRGDTIMLAVGVGE